MDPPPGLNALDFLQLVHQIDTQWPEYRRNFVALVAIEAGVIRWWSYPAARKWCTDRMSEEAHGLSESPLT
jgi:hypothetical protein